jgi:hypothetical protein
MAKFKCNQSGNVFEFSSAHDITTMREHSEYSEVEETPVVKPKKVKQDATSISRDNSYGISQDNGI